MTELGPITLVAAKLLRGETVVLPLRGHSMWPALKDGDRVVLRSAKPEDLRPGAIVAAIVGDRVVLHRIVAVVGGARGDRIVVSSGDNAAGRVDEPIAPSHVLGIASARIPPGASEPVPLDA